MLAVVPPRYAVVQGLVRTFAGRREGSFFADEMVARTSLLAAGGTGGEAPQRLLRPLYRAAPDMVIDTDDWTLAGRRVPLRAWYPVEVLTFPVDGTKEAERLDELVESGAYVVDFRLRDALRSLRGDRDSPDAGFPLPAEGSLTFAVPTVVDDAAYAVECAAVGEVDLVRLDRHIQRARAADRRARGPSLASLPAGTETACPAPSLASTGMTETQVRERAPEREAESEQPQKVERMTVIKPAPRRPHLDVPELWHYRELLGRFVWRDIKVRYKQTSLGIAWALLVPIFSAVVYVVVFGKFANFPAGQVPYATLVLSGLLVMQYFSSSLTGSSLSLVANLPLVTKVYFPRVLLPMAAAIVPAVDFAVGFLVLIPMMIYYRVGPDGVELLAAPLFLLLAFLTALGVGLSAFHPECSLPRRPTHAPGVHAGSAAVVGGAVRRPGDPREVAMDSRAQPHDDGRQRLAVGDAGGRGPPLGAGGCRCRSRRGPVRRRARHLPLVRAAIRGHDLMTAISAVGLSKRYRIGQLDAGYGTLRESIVHAVRRVAGREPRHDAAEREIWALRDVSFDVEEGAAVGVIGRNGAGKSTLLKVLTRITTPTEGRAEIRGRVGSLLEVGTGFHPELTGRENVYLNGSILGHEAP